MFYGDEEMEIRGQPATVVDMKFWKQTHEVRSKSPSEEHSCEKCLFKKDLHIMQACIKAAAQLL